jgi:hypothetical protein
MAYIPTLGDHTAWAGEFFHDDITIPNNTSANGTVLDLGQGASNGYIRIVGIASATVALADTKVLSFKVQDSADGTTFTGGLDITVRSITASGATTITKDQKQGKEVFNYSLPPTCRRYVRVVVTSTDTQQSGKVSVFPINTI